MTTQRKSKKKSKKVSLVTDLGDWREASRSFDAAWNRCQADTDQKKNWMRLSKRLGSCKHGSKLESTLGWLVDADVSLDAIQTINAWHQSLTKRVGRKRVAAEIIQAVDTVSDRSVEPDQALIFLAAAHSIRAIAGKCEYDDWHLLVSRLLEIAQATESDWSRAPDVWQQLSIELPLTMAFQIPEMEDHQDLANRMAQRMATRISEMLDHDGWPNASYLPIFGPLVASWVRCHVIISELELDQGQESASQLEWLVRQLFRMLRPDGTLLFSANGSNPVTRPFLQRLLELSGDPDDKRLMKYASGLVDRPKTSSVKLGIEPSNVSEWSESALLQSRWEHGTPKVGVDYSKPGVRTEICQRTSLIRGESMPGVSIDGVPLNSTEPFEVACVQCDDDVDYLELSLDMGRGVSLTRQYLLSRSEEFLLVADLIVPATTSRIDYRGSWPLAPGVSGLHESETREVYLVDDQSIQSLVLPLALPEWKVGASDDRLGFDEGRLVLTQSTEGKGLYAPLFFDLSPIRSKKKRTWRQLTVAEDLRILRRDEACAFRVHVDKQQWLLYRSVASVGNRTYLGENVVSEFAFSRFSKNGNSDLLLAIQ